MQIFAEFDSHEALLREFQNNLVKARAFVLGSYEVVERQLVEFVLIHPLSGEWLPLKAEVVYIAPSEPLAVGLEILEWNPERSALIQSFVEGTREEDTGGEGGAPLSPLELEGVELRKSLLPLDADEGSTSEMVVESLSPLDAFCDEIEPCDDDTRYDDVEPHSGANPPLSRRSTPPPRNVQERIRKLNMREREAMARGGTLTERVALERAYGAVVWDGLLANAALTGPEVARIAKNGNATIPHLTLIVNNPAWLSKGEVRRALLTNPRLTTPQIERVLRALPPAELKQLPKQTAYAPKVRAVAMRMLSR